ncbi:phosphatidate cytidylyltransferase [Salinisphaera dokdonensis CL-ES53]|uniref:Phosphatidate cytidylyltransferase n=1 Tax=Salinisphaera dokdonensis CL-ES53 TaxID=1304272 RepID=A0ABV2B394_9GAMM
MLMTRIATALAVVPLAVLGMLFLPTAAITLVFAVLMLMGAWEWGNLMRLADTGRILLTLTVALLIFLFALVRTQFWIVAVDNVVVGAACLWWLIAIYWITCFPKGWAQTVGRTDVGIVIGLIVLVAPVAAVTYLHQSDQGPLLLLTFFFLVWAADTGAYFAGRTVGRNKLAPAVSPGKTREGAIGGFVAAMLFAGAGAWLLGYSGDRLVAFMFLGGWVAIISVVGDLAISMFKRHAGIKDSGKLFPGHGGVLDRLDSVLAAAPWFVAGLHWLPSGV